MVFGTDKDKALLAIHSLMETLEKKPVGLVSSAVDTSSATGATKLAPFRKELYNELGQLTQQTKESSSEFLMRALEVKQKVIYASNESTEDMKYTKELIQILFVRSVTTGLSNITI